MIRTATQLKAKVRNLSGGDSKKARTLIRNFIMERFLERIALSQYRNNFILKGGMLVAAVVGLDTRATMDIDTTVKSMNLTKD
ncbi:MAG: nucleotidyl transferase AbiEii/AbiGii toxin family protein, partial [Lachnospiraceae bacterium]|nr:nucleotidyl transferase AbiEii/AbiGii toxin family protein [Lachnospiraceae bacterium]